MRYPVACNILKRSRCMGCRLSRLLFLLLNCDCITELVCNCKNCEIAFFVVISLPVCTICTTLKFVIYLHHCVSHVKYAFLAPDKYRFMHSAIDEHTKSILSVPCYIYTNFSFIPLFQVFSMHSLHLILARHHCDDRARQYCTHICMTGTTVYK